MAIQNSHFSLQEYLKKKFELFDPKMTWFSHTYWLKDIKWMKQTSDLA